MLSYLEWSITHFRNKTTFEHFPVDLYWSGQKINATSDHWYQNSEIYLHFMCSDATINFWKFHRDHLKTVATAQSRIFLKMGHLTWPGDLTSHDLGTEIFIKATKRMHKKVRKNGGAARCRFSAIRENLRGRLYAPPPAGHRSKLLHGLCLSFMWRRQIDAAYGTIRFASKSALFF